VDREERIVTDTDEDHQAEAEERIAEATKQREERIAEATKQREERIEEATKQREKYQKQTFALRQSLHSLDAAHHSAREKELNLLILTPGAEDAAVPLRGIALTESLRGHKEKVHQARAAISRHWVADTVHPGKLHGLYGKLDKAEHKYNSVKFRRNALLSAGAPPLARGFSQMRYLESYRAAQVSTQLSEHALDMAREAQAKTWAETVAEANVTDAKSRAALYETLHDLAQTNEKAMHELERKLWVNERKEKKDRLRFAEVVAPVLQTRPVRSLGLIYGVQASRSDLHHANDLEDHAWDAYMDEPSVDTWQIWELADLKEDVHHYDHMANLGKLARNPLFTVISQLRKQRKHEEYHDMVDHRLHEEFHEEMHEGSFGEYAHCGEYGCLDWEDYRHHYCDGYDDCHYGYSPYAYMHG